LPPTLILHIAIQGGTCLNLLFYHNIRMTNFVTLFLARYDSTTSTLTYSSAGHNPALLLHRRADRQDSIEWLEPTGAAIGLVEEFEFGEASVRLSPGDILLLYTDGVTEAMNPQREEFGSQRLAELVKQNQSVPAQELLLQVRLRLQEFSQGQPLADDITMVASKIV
jgi:sigma-B regulation protein RsbU (phosphoserine phosphatase)